MLEDSWAHNLTPKHVEEFQKAHGKAITRHVLAILGKNHDFYAAVSTPIGRELLKDLMDRMDELAVKLLSNGATETDKMEYNVRKQILDSWAQRIKVYEVHAQKLVQG